MAGGANRTSLIDAQQYYQQLGACDAGGVAHVRPAAADEPLDPEWRPIDLALESFEDWGAPDQVPWPKDLMVLCWWLPEFWRRSDWHGQLNDGGWGWSVWPLTVDLSVDSSFSSVSFSASRSRSRSASVSRSRAVAVLSWSRSARRILSSAVASSRSAASDSAEVCEPAPAVPS